MMFNLVFEYAHMGHLRVYVTVTQNIDLILLKNSFDKSYRILLLTFHYK